LALGVGALLLAASALDAQVQPTGDTILPVPADTIRPAPADTVKPVPADTVKPVPADTVKPIPGDTIPPVPGDSITPVPGDTTFTLPGDTISPAPGDTIATDTLKPVVVVAPLRSGDAPGWTAGIWEWDRDALLRSSAMTLTDLLAEIPGVTPIRAGFLGHSEAVALPGGAGGFSEIYLDGFALDPLGASTYDLSRFELVNLNRVQVRRRGSGLRIDLETVAPTDHRPYSLIEAGTGDQGARLFRGTFMTPDFLLGPLALGIERLEGNGWLGTQPANTFTGWMKWARGFGAGTLQFELRRNTVEWETAERETMKGFRQDLIFRARTKPLPGLTTEAFLGASSIEDQYQDTLTNAGGVQGGIRAAYQTDNHWINAVVRADQGPLNAAGMPVLEEEEVVIDLRSSGGKTFLPGLATELSAGVRLPGTLLVSGDLSRHNWLGERAATSWAARSELGPILGLRPFVELSRETRGIQQFHDDAGLPILTERDLLRAGAEFGWRRLRLGAAWSEMRADSIADFGLPFDRTGTLYPGGTMRGIEVTGRIPLHTKPFWLQGWYTRWTGDSPWIYLPEQSWRAALAYHDTPLPSGNLEVDARLELSHRDGMIVPTMADGIAGTAAVPGLTSMDFYLQIRILDVRAFVRWNNITHTLYQHDLPGRLLPGQRTIYGIKWSFWN
jgi:hypothetical protein